MVTESLNISPLMKDLIDELLKDIDYNSNSIESNSCRALTLYVLNKVAIKNNKKQDKATGKYSGTTTYLYRGIKNVMNKLCATFQEPGNSNILNVLTLWLNTFGVIFEKADKESEEFQKEYGLIKD